MTGDDRDLYEIHAALRREEEALVPPMPSLSLLAREHGRRRPLGKLATLAVCLATAIAAALWLQPKSRVRNEGLKRGGAETAASITTWRPSTDFLLDTPGRELLLGVPDVGEWRAAVIAPGPGKRQRRFKSGKQVLP
jgi:hypothetical protein